MPPLTPAASTTIPWYKESTRMRLIGATASAWIADRMGRKIR